MKRFLQFFTPDRAIIIGFTVFLVCVPCFVFCQTHHFCMEGHLQDKVTFLDKANDSFWQSGFVVAMLLSFRSGITFRHVFTFATSVGFLLIASPLNFGGILILPVTGAACLFAIASLIGWID
jgi:hypothetical protein